MKIISHHTISSLARQFVNCWLAYTLSQPVNIDLPVALYFVKLYLGVPLIQSSFYRMRLQTMALFQKEEVKETIEELIPQESYS